MVNPAFRFAVLQGAELRAVGDPKSQEANGVSVTPASINLPLQWRLGMDKGSDADAYGQLLLR